MPNPINNKTFLFCLFLIILLGVGLRFYDLTAESLWTDEMISLIHLRAENAKELIDSVIYAELMPPGYFLMLQSWANYFGESEFSLRFLSVLFDCFSIILVYLLGKKVFNQKVGLLSALVFSTTMLPIVYAQEARPYALFGFLVLLSSYLFLCLYQNDLGSKRKYYFLRYTLVNAVSLYINYLALFELLFHLLIFLFFFYFQSKSSLKTQIFSFISTFILFLPGMQILYLQALIRHPILQKTLILRGVPEFLSNLGILFYLLPLIISLFFFVFGFYIFKKYLILRFKQEYLVRTILFFALLLGIVHLILLETILRSFALIRHSFFTFPFFIILLAWAVLKIKPNQRKLTAILIILLFNSYTLLVYYTETTKAPWAEAVNFISEHSDQNILILFDRSGSNVLLYDYYSSPNFRHLNLTWEERGKLVQINEEELFQNISKEKNFWLVSSRNIKTGDYYQELLIGKFPLILEKKYKELDLYYFKSST